MKIRPDFRRKRNQSQRVLELKRPLHRLVPEENHAEQAARPPTQRAEQHQERFRRPRTPALRPPLVEPKPKKREHAKRAEPDCRE